jgi:RNA polymerase sigma-70 factor (ECF subfamily)
MRATRHQEASPHHLDDDALMTRINSLDVEEALGNLKTRYGPRVLSFVYAIVRDRHLAEDVWQEVLAKVFFKSHLYCRGTNFQAWLFEIARNQALTALRRKRRSPRSVGGDSWDDQMGVAESALRGEGEYLDRRPEEAELLRAFEDAVEALPERYRRVFELCVRGGMQYRDAAAALGVPKGTVAIRIMRARQRLFRELGRHVGRLRQPPACLQRPFPRASERSEGPETHGRSAGGAGVRSKSRNAGNGRADASSRMLMPLQTSSRQGAKP